MLRKVVIAVVLTLVLAAPAQAQQIRTLLMPGVTYSRDVEFTPHGPVVLHVINAPKPGGLYSLLPGLSNNAIVGRETVTSIEKRMTSTATVAGVNGDLFNWRDGHPSGALIRGGVLEHPPLAERSSVGIDADGNLHVDRVRMSGYWVGTGQRRAVGLNELAGPNGVSLFTPSWGPSTPATQGVEAVVQPFPAVRANTDLVGTVVRLGSTNGATAIPPDGAVLQARGKAAGKLALESALGGSVTVRFTLTPGWDSIVDALGGGPVIIRNGKPVFRANEGFSASQLAPRNPRTAVGQRADGRILLVAVDGRQLGYSVGMTNFELALALMRLGAVTASALDAGGSTTMAFDGQLLNRPSDPGGERAVAEALLVAYTGVYVPQPAEDVVSPNGDGVDEKQTFTYRLVRPSTVQASLVAPDKTTLVPLDSGQRAPGVYRLTWNATDAAEGEWRFTVSATDDQSQPSSADRLFSVNNTLSSLSAAPKAMRLGRSKLTGSFTLAHPAKVTITIENARQIVLRLVGRSDLEPGSYHFSWNGRDARARLVVGGTLNAHVSATNELGRVDLRAPFTARR